jgi:hypothetical protein
MDHEHHSSDGSSLSYRQRQEQQTDTHTQQSTCNHHDNGQIIFYAGSPMHDYLAEVAPEELLTGVPPATTSPGRRAGSVSVSENENAVPRRRSSRRGSHNKSGSSVACSVSSCFSSFLWTCWADDRPYATSHSTCPRCPDWQLTFDAFTEYDDHDTHEITMSSRTVFLMMPQERRWHCHQVAIRLHGGAVHEQQPSTPIIQEDVKTSVMDNLHHPHPHPRLRPATATALVWQSQDQQEEHAKRTTNV